MKEGGRRKGKMKEVRERGKGERRGRERGRKRR